jgi:hypothetical protein
MRNHRRRVQTGCSAAMAETAADRMASIKPMQKKAGTWRQRKAA